MACKILSAFVSEKTFVPTLMMNGSPNNKKTKENFNCQTVARKLNPRPPAASLQPVGVADAIYLDNLICKLQVQVECAQRKRKRERYKEKEGGALANAHGLTHTATPLLPSRLAPPWNPFALLLPGIQLDNQTHKQKAPKNRKERTKQKAAQWRYCAAYGAKGGGVAWG